MDYLKNEGTHKKKYTGKMFIKLNFTNAHQNTAKLCHKQQKFHKWDDPLKVVRKYSKVDTSLNIG